MTLFKDFIHNMTHSLLTLFILSFAIGAMEGGAGKPDFEIAIRKVTFNSIILSSEVKFCVAASPIHINLQKDIGLPGIKSQSFYKMEELGLLNKDDYNTIMGLEDYNNYTTETEAFDLDSPEDDKIRWDHLIKWEHFEQCLHQSNTHRDILRKRKGVAGEIASTILFKHLGYKSFNDDYYRTYRQPLFKNDYNDNDTDKVAYEVNHPYCDSQNRSNHGIDAIFIPGYEHSGQHSHIIINESKCRDANDLDVNEHFHILPANRNRLKSWRQSHSLWNQYNFTNINNGCLATELGSHNQQTIIRTATLLNPSGEIKLYEIKDQADGRYNGGSDFIRKTYATQIPFQLSLLSQLQPLLPQVTPDLISSSLQMVISINPIQYNNYSLFQQNVSTKGYTLH
jgi:hypothetical protein